MEDPDRHLLRRARRGDRRAFGELAERHQQRLFTLAARTLGSREEAEDAVQETLLRAWLALPRFREDARFSTWLYRICVNAAHDVRTQRRPQPAEQPSEPADPRDRLAEQELSSTLQDALRTLDQTYRLAVVMYDLLGCPYSEIAEVTGVPEGTVKSRIFRGRAELARALGTETVRQESEE